MLDKFDRQLAVGDLILHSDRSNMFPGLVIEENEKSIKYILLTEIDATYVHLVKYGIKSSTKVVKLEITPDILRAPFRNWYGVLRCGTYEEAIKFTLDEYYKGCQ